MIGVPLKPPWGSILYFNARFNKLSYAFTLAPSIHSHRDAMKLLRWNMIYKLGECQLSSIMALMYFPIEEQENLLRIRNIQDFNITSSVFNVDPKIKIICRIILLPTYYKTPLNNAQCLSMPIKIMALIRNASKCQSLPISADQFLSMPINAGSRHQ